MNYRKIVDYKILRPEEGLFDIFVLNINDEIAKGWQPIGGIAASTVREDDKVTLFQAMVKYKETTTDLPESKVADVFINGEKVNSATTKKNLTINDLKVGDNICIFSEYLEIYPVEVRAIKKTDGIVDFLSVKKFGVIYENGNLTSNFKKITLLNSRNDIHEEISL